MGRTALLACPEGGTSLSAMAGLDRSSFNTEPGLRSISFSLLCFCAVCCCRQLFCCKVSVLALSVIATRCQLSQRESLWRNRILCVLTGNFSAMPRPLPLRKDFPRAGGRCRASDKRGSVDANIVSRRRGRARLRKYSRAIFYFLRKKNRCTLFCATVLFQIDLTQFPPAPKMASSTVEAALYSEPAACSTCSCVGRLTAGVSVLPPSAGVSG